MKYVLRLTELTFHLMKVFSIVEQIPHYPPGKCYFLIYNRLIQIPSGGVQNFISSLHETHPLCTAGNHTVYRLFE
jgi:hypothetical protein